MLDMRLIKRRKDVLDKFTEVAYWRKANQIRAWFKRNLDNFADNGMTIVSKSDLEKLLAVCKEVSNSHITDKAKRLLPTSEGYFFGSLAYDKYYYQNVDYTIKVIEKLLDELNFDEWEIYYDEIY